MGQLGARRGDAFGPCTGQQQVVAALSRGNVLLQALRPRYRLVVFGWGNGFIRKQFVGPFGIGLGSFQLGHERFPIVLGRLDFLRARSGFHFGQLRGHLLPAGAKLRRIQGRQRLPRLERVAFGCENALHAPAVTGSYAHLVRFDGTGNGVRVSIGPTADQQQRQGQQPGGNDRCTVHVGRRVTLPPTPGKPRGSLPITSPSHQQPMSRVNRALTPR